MRRRLIALVLSAGLIAAGCSAPEVPDDGFVQAPEAESGKKKGSSENGARGAGGEAGKGKKNGKGRPDGTTEGVAENDTGGDAAAAGGLEPLGEGGPEYARLSARVEEPEPDSEKSGVTPAYSEANAVDVEGLGEDFRVTMSFNGNVPQKMPNDKTVMVIGFSLPGEKKNEKGYAFGGQASERGWQAFAGAKSETRRFPGTFIVRDNQIVMTIPWSFVGGPRPFEWYCNASWFQNVAGVTSYSFDVIPNDKGRYPD